MVLLMDIFQYAVIIIPFTVGVFSGLGGWILGRRKYKADSYLTEIEGMKEKLSFNEQVISNLKDTVAYYIEISKQNSSSLHILKTTVDELIDDTCLRKGCTKRIRYSEAKIKKITDLTYPISGIEDKNKSIKEDEIISKKNNT